MNKHEIRKKFQTIRKNIASEKKEKYSQIILKKLEKIVHSSFLKHNKTLNICLFASTKNEPNITELVTIFHQEIAEKKICFYFPKCENTTNISENIMNFYSVKTLSDLEYEKNSSQKFHILEPNKTCEILKIEHTPIDFFIIPAVSIDRNYNRIGMGAGFYDRYLQRYFELHNKKESTIICTLFSEQISETLFTEFIEKFDIPADKVVTEK